MNVHNDVLKISASIVQGAEARVLTGSLRLLKSQSIAALKPPSWNGNTALDRHCGSIIILIGFWVLGNCPVLRKYTREGPPGPCPGGPRGRGSPAAERVARVPPRSE